MSPSTTPNGNSHPPGREPARLVVVSAGVSDPSSTRLLANRITQMSLDLVREAGIPATAGYVELGPLAIDVARATVTGFPNEELQDAIARIANADALIAATPVYGPGHRLRAARNGSGDLLTRSLVWRCVRSTTHATARALDRLMQANIAAGT